MPILRLSDFSGGLNLRDAPNRIAANETPFARDWTFYGKGLYSGGAPQLRRGCALAVTLPGVTLKKAWIFYSAALDQWLCVRETTGAPSTLRLHTRPGDLSGSWTDRGAVNSVVTARAAFIDFPGATPKVVIATDVNSGATKGIWTWDGTTLTSVSTTVAGSAIALWQNKAWVAGYPTSDSNGNPTRLFACAAGDPTTWAVASGGLTVDVRDKDAQALTAVALAGGSLVVFKARSAYRITDSSTGAFATIDPATGSLVFGATTVRGRIYTWAPDGLYEWDGIGSGRLVGDKGRDLFLEISGTDTPAGGQFSDRVIFAFPSSPGGANSNVLEYDPAHRWLMYHSFPTSGFSSFARQDADTYGAYYQADKLLRMFAATPGNDDGVNYSNGVYSTPWIQPNGGKLVRIRRIAVEGALEGSGSNTLTLKVFQDWNPNSGSTDFDITSDLRSSSLDEARSVIQSLPHARAYLFKLVVGTGTGTVQVNGIELDWDPLEL